MMHGDGTVPPFVMYPTDPTTLTEWDRTIQFGHVLVAPDSSSAGTKRFQSLAEARRTLEGAIPCPALVWRARLGGRAVKDEYVEAAQDKHPFTPLALLRRFFFPTSVHLAENAHRVGARFDADTDRWFGLAVLAWSEGGGGRLDTASRDYITNGTFQEAWMTAHHPRYWVLVQDEAMRRHVATYSRAAAKRLAPIIDAALGCFLKRYRLLMAATVAPTHLAEPRLAEDDVWHLAWEKIRRWRLIYPVAWEHGMGTAEVLDVRACVRAGYSIAATLVWSQYQLHRLMDMALQQQSPCLMHQVHRFCDSMLPLTSMMARWGRWRDADCTSEIELPLAARHRFDDSIIVHPAAAARLTERAQTRAQLVMAAAAAHLQQQPQRRRHQRQSQQHQQQNAPKFARTPHHNREEARRASVPEAPQRCMLLRDFWPVSTDAATFEEIASITPLLSQFRLTSESEHRRGVVHFLYAMSHFFITKLGPRKCSTRGIDDIARTFMRLYPAITRMFSQQLLTAALGNITGVLEHRLAWSSRVRVWLTLNVESLAASPLALTKLCEHEPLPPEKRRRAVVNDSAGTLVSDARGVLPIITTALREILCTFMELLPTQQLALRAQTPRVDMWRPMMRQLASTWRRRLNILPAFVPHDPSYPPCVWARAFVIHTAQLSMTLQSGHKKTGHSTNLMAREEDFVGTIHKEMSRRLRQLAQHIEGERASLHLSERAANRRMRDVAEWFQRQCVYRWITTHYPPQYHPGMMRLVAWKRARADPGLRKLGLYILAYFGVADEVIYALNSWSIYFYRYDLATDRLLEPLNQLWARYPESMSVVYTFFSYLLAYREEQPLLLSRQIAETQLRARAFAIQLDTTTLNNPINQLTLEHLKTCWYCPVCRRWAHAIAADANLEYSRSRDKSHWCDPVEVAREATVQVPQRPRGRPPAPAKRPHSTLNANDLAAEESTLDEALVRMLSAALTFDDVPSTTTTPSPPPPPPPKTTARTRQMSSLGIAGPSPSDMLAIGSGTPVNMYVLGRRSGGGGTTNNGDNVGVSNEAGGLYPTDFVAAQYDPLRRRALCTSDQSKRSDTLLAFVLFEDNRIATTAHEIETLLLHKQVPPSIRQTSRRVAVVPDDVRWVEVQERHRRWRTQPGHVNLSEYIAYDAPESLYMPATKVVGRFVNLQTHIEDAMADRKAMDKKRKKPELSDIMRQEAYIDSCTRALELQIERARTQLEQSPDITGEFELLSGSVTRARRCGVTLEPAAMIGAVRRMNGVWYAVCGLCGSLVQALPEYCHAEYGYTCPRHGLTVGGFDTHANTFLASPSVSRTNANAQHRLTVSDLTQPGWWRMTPCVFVTRVEQLAGLPRQWLHRYHVDTPEQAVALARVRVPEGRMLLRQLQSGRHPDRPPVFARTPCQGTVLVTTVIPYPFVEMLARRGGDGAVHRSYICDECYATSARASIYMETHAHRWFGNDGRWHVRYYCSAHYMRAVVERAVNAPNDPRLPPPMLATDSDGQ